MDIKNVEVFAVGTWNGMKFVDEDLTEMAENTNLRIKEKEMSPPLKLGHSTEQILQGQTDGDPRMGSAVNFRAKEHKLICDFVDIPDVINKAIEKKMYNQVSVELKYLEKFGWYVSGVALLGADQPAVKVLDDLKAYLSDLPVSDSSEQVYLKFSEPIIKKRIKMGDEKTQELERKLAEVEKAYAKKEAEFNQKENDFIAEKATLEKEKAEMIFKQEREKVLSEYKADVQAGKLQPAVYEKLEKYIDETKFSDGIKISPEMNRELIKGYSAQLPQGESSENSDKVEATDEAITAEIYKVMAATGKNYVDAEEFSFNTNPALWGNYYNDFTSKIHRGI